jgi:peptidoglycan/xylan/chitin deacetylase (PgdA/CDA1 family)
MKDERPHHARPLISRTDLMELCRAGVGLGSHSRRHPDLVTLDEASLREELHGSRAELEDMLGQKVDCFAYPYGHVNESIRRCVAEAGYTCAFSTRSGFSRADDDHLLVRRIDVYGTDTPGSLLRKVRFGTNDGSLITAGRYYARRAAARLRIGALA